MQGTGTDSPRFHSKDLRRGRISVTGNAYLVTTVTLGRQPLFADFVRACIAARCFDYPRPHSTLQSLAWVVMPDHVHWLLVPGEHKTLSAIMREFKAYVARALNRCDGTTGRCVWQPGFHDHALRPSEDLRGTARYILANPLRAGLVGRIGDYPFWDAVWL